MIEHYEKKYEAEVITLWQEAFGDTSEVAREYILHILKSGEMLLYKENEAVLAMLSLLPVSCKEKKGSYVYAVATTSDRRGEGICKRLMRFAEEMALSRGEDFLILVPAEKSLFEFYKRLGYCETVFAPRQRSFKETSQMINDEDYYKMRRDCLDGLDLIEWSVRDLSFILSRGRAVLTEDGAAFIENERAIEVLSRKGYEKGKPFALIKYLGDFKFKKPYFGLAMN